MTHQKICKLFFVSAVLATGAMGFTVTPQTRTTAPSSFNTALQAKKKKGKKAGQGFGKEPPAPTSTTSNNSNKPIGDQMTTTTTAPGDAGSFLQSVEGGGSDAIPTVEPVAASSSSDSALPPEERAKKLLREQYGMRTMAEQKMEDQLQSNRARLDELKKMADSDQDLDIMKMVPAPILRGVDTFLKVGVGVCTVLFVAAGFSIALEAWSVTSGNPLPENIDNFIVNTVEPNFTPGLAVLLGFSVSLGAFAALQLSSGSATYKEE